MELKERAWVARRVFGYAADGGKRNKYTESM